jgi:hypothetical protein
MKGTIYGIVAFFLVALGLYLLYQSAAADRVQEVDASTLITAGESDETAETASGVAENASESGTGQGTAGSIAGDTGGAAEAGGTVESAEPATTDALPATD